MHHPRTTTRALRHNIDRLRARLMNQEPKAPDLLRPYLEDVAHASLRLMYAGEITPATADFLNETWKHAVIALATQMERTPPPDDVVL